MRLVIPESDIRAAYPEYDACSALLFGHCFLSIVGEAHGPFKIEKSVAPLERFKTLCAHSFLDLRLWYLSPIPVGVQKQVEARAHAALDEFAIKHAWFDITLDQAIAAVTGANPLARLIDVKAMTHGQLIAASDDFWAGNGVLPLDRTRGKRRRRVAP